MKGIILAGGLGSRLYPVTLGVSKQLLPVYDKPMIYYPLSTLMLAGIRNILIITTGHDIDNFKKTLGEGKRLGIKINYAIQEKPEGLAQSFLIGEDFIKKDNVCLILGDNIFFGHNLVSKLNYGIRNLRKNYATIYGYRVSNPSDYGVVQFDKKLEIKKIQEKPKRLISNYAITGLYFYPNSVISIAKRIKKSSRGEYEITDVNKHFLNKRKLKLQIFERGFAWLDAGKHDSLNQASSFIETVEKRQGFKIACLEEIAYRSGFINRNNFLRLIKKVPNNQYKKYLTQLI